MILATVLLEANRWKNKTSPVFHWSDFWAEAILSAGFEGIELWENHWTLADTAARRSLMSGACPVRVFNWYGHPGTPQEATLLETIDLFSDTLLGVKFNVPAGEDLSASAEAAARLAERLPPDISLLCECHAGTPLESPSAAKSVFDSWPQNIKAILHPFTPDASQWWHHLGPRITHLHLQANTNGAWVDPVPGIPLVDEGLRLLREHHFDGTASLEFIAGITQQTDPHHLLNRASAVRKALAQTPVG